MIPVLLKGGRFDLLKLTQAIYVLMAMPKTAKKTYKIIVPIEIDCFSGL